MANSKRCIFHVPNYIDINRKSGSNIRPIKMIKAFKDNGYVVDVVMGYAKERKKQIKQIKNNIKNGIHYDFLYSESSTMPTILTEKKHIPTHPRLDFSFIKFCKKNGIKIGLFYRDIHWRFPLYKNEVSGIKRILAIICYKYDLYKYKKLLDILYIPTKQLVEYFPERTKNNVKYEIKLLPPGCEEKIIKEVKNIENKPFTIFYVGGISEDIYNFEKLFKVVNGMNNVRLIVCCRQNDWNAVKENYSKYLNQNIDIVHANSYELEKYYEQADVASLILKPQEYMKIAMPVKTFEYLSNNKPIIGTKGTAVEAFIEENQIGWTIEYEEEKIRNIIEFLKSNPEELEKIKNNQKRIIKDNTWSARAKKVIDDLCSTEYNK